MNHLSRWLTLISAITMSVALAQAAPEAGIDALQAAASAHPDDGQAQYALGLALRNAGRHRQAIVAFDRAAGLGFQAGAAQLRAAQSEAELGDRTAAMRRVNALAESQPVAFGPTLQAVGGIAQLAADPQFRATLAAVDAKRYPCRGRTESHQFDFWIGEWKVTDPEGQPLGTSSVTDDLQGCMVREAWSGGYGGKGTSVNFYDPATRQWHQVWTDDSGTVTNYVGELREGAMRFHAEGFGDADGVHHQRTLVFTPNADGSVEQVFQDSADGKEWKTTFDGHYLRMTH